MEQNQSVSLEQLDATLTRFAKIAVGVAWSFHRTYTAAAEAASVSCVTLCYHLGVAKSLGVERTIKSSIQKALDVYYAKAISRDEPLRDEEEIRFEWSRK